MKRNRAIVLVLAAAASCMATAGCATILGGGSDKNIAVKSNPSGIDVAVYNSHGDEVTHGITPFTATLHRSNGFFSAEKYTFKPVAAGTSVDPKTVNAGLNAWYLGNLLFGGIPGLLIVDPLTGAMWDFPGEVTVEAGHGSSSAAPGSASPAGSAFADANRGK